MTFSPRIIAFILFISIHLGSQSQPLEALMREATDSIQSHRKGPRTLYLINEARKLVKAGSIEEAKVNLLKGQYYFYRYEDNKVISTLKPYLRNISNDTLIAKYSFYIGDSYIFLSQPDSALRYFKIARNKLKGLGLADFEIKVHRNLGDIYFESLNEDLAFVEYDTAISLMAQFNDSSLYAQIKSNAAACLMQLNDLTAAKRIFFELVRNPVVDDKYLGRIYNYLGALYSKQDSFDLAKTYFLKSIPLLERNKEKRILGTTYYNLIDVYLALDDLENAMESARLAEPLYLKYNPANLGYLYNGLGNICLKLNQNHEAREYFLKALEIAKVEKQWREAEIATGHISSIYESERKFKQSLLYLKENLSYKDSIFEITKLEAIEKYRIQFEAEQNEQKIRNLEELNSANSKRAKAENKIRAIYFSIAIALCLLLIVAIYIIGRFKMVKHKMQTAEKLSDLNNKLILNRLNPHFIFNVLNSIQYYINTENKSKASHYLLEFAKLLRQFMSSFSQDYHSLKEELTLLAKYLELEKILNKDSFQFEIRVQSDVNQAVLIPTMILQPLLENSIKHGTTNDNPLVQLHIEESNEQLICIVEDNGTGIVKNVDPLNSKGLDLIMERISTLNIKLENKITISLQNKTNGTSGTKTILKLPKSTWHEGFANR